MQNDVLCHFPQDDLLFVGVAASEMGQRLSVGSSDISAMPTRTNGSVPLLLCHFLRDFPWFLWGAQLEPFEWLEL